MITQKQLKDYFLSLKNAVYVWGADGQKITQELMDSLYKSHGTAKYNKTYYKNKFIEGCGRIGADCSGAFRKVSGYDTTAAGYYNRCKKKGKISTLPKNKICMVFKRDYKKKINHIGCYTGDGYVSELASSKLNYQRKKLDGNGWDDWGYPDFISDYDTYSTDYGKEEEEMNMPTIKKGSTGKVVKIWQVIVGVEVDGEFGSKTKATTIELQKELFPDEPKEWDGIVGPKTWKGGLDTIIN